MPQNYAHILQHPFLGKSSTFYIRYLVFLLHSVLIFDILRFSSDFYLAAENMFVFLGVAALRSTA